MFAKKMPRICGNKYEACPEAHLFYDIFSIAEI